MKWLNPKHDKIPKDKYILVTIADKRTNYVTCGYRFTEELFTDVINEERYIQHINIKNIVAWMDLPDASVGFNL